MMEQFEKWFNDFDCDTINCHGIGCDTLCKEIRAETWRAALEWLYIEMTGYDSTQIRDMINKELGDT